MSKSISSIIIIIIVLLVAGGFGYYYIFYANQGPSEGGISQFYQNNSQSPPQDDQNQNNQNQDGQEAPQKAFSITAKNFSFSLPEIRVQKGDKVKIILDNVEGFHDWTVDEFNAKTQQSQAPAKTEVEFIADKSGTFEFYCGVGNHRQMGMKGSLIVEE